jgi:hypothetical protein
VPVSNDIYTPEEPYVFKLIIPRQVIPTKTMKNIKSASTLIKNTVVAETGVTSVIKTLFKKVLKNLWKGPL